MEFRRFGKSFQMKLENGVDLKEAMTLDEALWVALSAPKDAFQCDPSLVNFLDVDNDGRITAKDIRRAIKWLLDQLPDAEKITADFDGSLKITDITSKTDEGKALIDSASWIVTEMGAKENGFITLTQVRDFLANVKMRDLNGDGVLTLRAAQRASTDAYKEEVTELVKNVVATTGGALDLDGTQGLDEKTMATFLEAIPQYLDWHAKGLIPDGETKTDIMSMGPDTPALNALIKANAEKIDQFFKISELLDFDSRIQPKSLSPESKVAAFDPALQAEVDAYQDSLPIATPNAECLLPLDPEEINPAYRAWFTDLVTKVIKPVIGEQKEGMSKADWANVKGTFAAYNAYLASKKGEIVEKLPIDVLKKYVSCDELLNEVHELMKIDLDVAKKTTAAHQMEKLILYRTELLHITNNFISFTDLYSEEKHAMFEAGKLVIDGRWFAVAFRITSFAAHQALAKNCQLFLMYVDVQPKTGAKYSVVVPVTSGTKGNLMVGKRGIFYDNDGNDCDATVTNIVENPVCVKEALLAPFGRLWGIVEGKINEWSGAAEKNLQGNFTKAITPGAAPAAAAAAAPAPAAPAKDAKDGGSKANAFMGIGIAAAAIGSAFTFLMKTLTSMSATAIWITVIVAILALMLPITIIAIIKLSRQDLGSVLEGCGWGINMKLRLDTKLRNQFTYFGKYPTGAKGTPKSYALRWCLIIILIIVASVGGCKYWKYRKTEKARIEAEKVEMQKKKEAEEKAEEAKKAAEKAAETKSAEDKEAAKQAAAELKQVKEEVKAAEAKTAEAAAEVEQKKAEEKAAAEAKAEQTKQVIKEAAKEAVEKVAENAAKK